MKMNKIIATFFLFLLPFVSLHAAPSLNLSKAVEQTTAPNPSSLTSNWWDYYNADSSETLSERKKATAELYQKIQNELPPDVRARLQPAFDRVLIQLQSLIDLKSLPPQPNVESPLPKKTPTFDEWVALIPQVLEKEKELEYLQIQTDLTKSSLKSGSKYVDTLFSAYLKEATDDPKRLEDGLRIIQARIVLAIERIQISNLSESIEGKKKRLTQLTQDLENLFGKINFSALSPDLFIDELKKAQEAENSSYNAFFLAYEASMAVNPESGDKELADQKMIEARILYETTKMKKVRIEILQLLTAIERREKGITRKSIQEKSDRWQAASSDIEYEIPNWEASSEALLEQSLGRLRSNQNGFHLSKMASENAILNIQELKDEIFINQFLLDTLDVVSHKTAFGFFDTLLIWWDSGVNFIKQRVSWFNQSLFKIGEIPVTPWGLIKVIIIVVAFYCAGKLSARGLIYFGSKQRTVAKASIYVFSKLSYYILFFLGIIIGGTVLGLDLTVLGYVAGALALWVGLSLQSIFHNFISGIIVLLTKMIRINDLIELESGEKGTVSSINLRTTIVETLTGSEMIVPNSEFVSKKFINHTLYLYVKRQHIPFRIGLDEDRDFVIQVVKEAAKKVEITSESREPEVWLLGYGDNYVKMELVVWVNIYIQGNLAARDPQYFWALDVALRENNIKIPVPQTIIHHSEEKPISFPPPPEKEILE